MAYPMKIRKCRGKGNSFTITRRTPNTSEPFLNLVSESYSNVEFIANGNQWPDDPPLVCEANFPYDLAPHQTDVVIGDDRLFGSFRARSDLGDPLLCDTVWGVPLPSARNTFL